ncbi:hypothetical protein [Mucilaginibacter sp. BT774]|uniref:type I restriction endonuclease subunit R, EcoR124 family n=1 Tax=Mucilaginibacter sp. BT774 TaxID=3062276 RepID=UPI002674A8E3|nr:hypothetical protein [Mucilaginibacter sp. BT774]MDO3628565.1 hypothetical protein [Mucilaginibacter sp. BT774]
MICKTLIGHINDKISTLGAMTVDQIAELKGISKIKAMQNYDEFAGLKALQHIDITNPEALEEFKAKYYLSDDNIAAMKLIGIPFERTVQDYRSTYNDIRDWLRHQKSANEKEASTIDWDDVIFEVDQHKVNSECVC